MNKVNLNKQEYSEFVLLSSRVDIDFYYFKELPNFDNTFYLDNESYNIYIRGVIDQYISDLYNFIQYSKYLQNKYNLESPRLLMSNNQEIFCIGELDEPR